MSINLDNSTDTVNLGDVKVRRKNSSTVEIPSQLEVAGIKTTASGITFPDNSVQTTAATGGGSGSSGPDFIYNPIDRYALISTNGQQVWATSASTVHINKAWERTGTSLTIVHPSHGRSIGDRVLLRNTNVVYQNALISDVDTDTFTVNCEDLGELSGTGAAYALGFTYAHNSSTPGSIANGIMSSPAGSDVRLLSCRFMFGANTRAATNYVATFPISALAYTGIGQNTRYDDMYVPIVLVRQLTATLVAVGNTITANINSNPASYQIAALPAVATPTILLFQF